MAVALPVTVEEYCFRYPKQEMIQFETIVKHFSVGLTCKPAYTKGADRASFEEVRSQYYQNLLSVFKAMNERLEKIVTRLAEIEVSPFEKRTITLVFRSYPVDATEQARMLKNSLVNAERKSRKIIPALKESVKFVREALEICLKKLQAAKSFTALYISLRNPYPALERDIKGDFFNECFGAYCEVSKALTRVTHQVWHILHCQASEDD